jgi:hypothetical protein
MNNNQSRCAVSPDQDFSTAQRFMNVSIGSHYLFNKNIIAVKYIPLKDISCCYKRVEENAPGCGCVTILSKYLIIVDKDINRMKIPLDNGLVIDDVMEMLKKANPTMKLGYYAEQNADNADIPCLV